MLTMTKGTPGVKETLQAPANTRNSPSVHPHAITCVTSPSRRSCNNQNTGTIPGVDSLDVGEEVHNVLVGEVLLGSNAGCNHTKIPIGDCSGK